jgi:hypothetical protein
VNGQNKIDPRELADALGEPDGGRLAGLLRDLSPEALAKALRALWELMKRLRSGIAPGTLEIRAFRKTGLSDTLDQDQIPATVNQAAVGFDVTGRVLTASTPSVIWGTIYTSNGALAQNVTASSVTADGSGNVNWRLAFGALGQGTYILVVTWIGPHPITDRGTQTTTFTVVPGT